MSRFTNGLKGAFKGNRIVNFALVFLLVFVAQSVSAQTYSFGSFSSGSTLRYTDTDGNFTLSWSSRSGTEYYKLKRGAATLLQSKSLSKTQSGLAAYPNTYTYKVYSCYIEEDEYDEDDNWEVCRQNPTTIEVTIPVPKPPTPSMTGSTTSYNGSYTVSWSAASGATSYKWRTRANYGSWSGETTTTSRSFPVSGKGTGRYGYQVRACNNSGCSSYSSERTVTVVRTPGVPSYISFDKNPSDPTLVVSWGSSTGSVTKYDYDYKKSTTSSWSNGYDGSGRSKTLTGLSAGTWNHRVRACYTAYSRTTCSGWRSQIGSVVTPPANVSKPSVNGARNNTTGKYIIDWDDESDRSYVLEQSINGGSYSSVSYKKEDDGPDTYYSASFSNRSDGVYTYRTKICNSAGCTVGGSTTVNVARNPSVPASVSTSPSLGDGEISISWSSGSYATTYDLEYQKNSGSWVNSYDGSARSYQVNFAAGKYRFRVRACNVRGAFSNCSGWRYGSTVTVAVPGVPNLSLATADNNGSYTVSWSSVGNTRKYTLQERTGSGGWATIQDTSATSRAISGKSNNTYGYRIRACNNAGCSSFSSEKRIDVALTPGVPSSIAAPAVHDGDFTVSWGAGSGSITKYDLDQSKNNGGYTNAYDGGSRSKVFSNLSAGSYVYRVRACRTTGGYTSCSGWRTSSTSLAAVPSAIPGGLSVPSSDNNGAYSVSWGSTSNTSKYTLQERAGSGGWVTVQDSSATSRAVSGKGNNTYGYRVRACNDLGCSAFSGEKRIDVAITPGVPSSITAPSSHDGEFFLKWGTSTGSVTKYDVDQSFNGAQYTNLYDGTASSQKVTVSKSGNYVYRVRGCRTTGSYTSCSGWRVSTTSVAAAPSAAPVVSAPASNSSGNYRISWTNVSLATSYRVQEGTGSSWGSEKSTSYTSESISKTKDGNYKYRARACNKLGCGPYSSSKTVAVAINSTIDNPIAPVLASAPPPSNGLDQSRTMDGEFNVTPGGQATYEIEVLTARGTAGLQPKVSLNYSSGGGNSLVGMGWSLNAGSRISRCRQTLGQDKKPMAITWSDSDRFCINGQRLLVESGEYGSPGSTYKTEIDNYARVTAVGGISGHPNPFKVEYKNGLIENFGGTADSREQLDKNNGNTVFSWAINERLDALNNRIQYTYHNSDDFGQRLNEINFAFAGFGTRGAHIKFEYGTRKDVLTTFVGGHKKVAVKRLTKIISYSNDQVLREYSLIYNTGSAATSNDKLSRLSEMKECVGSICAVPTKFEWSIPKNNFGAPTNFAIGGIGVVGASASPKTFGDFNGDGYTDIAWLDRNTKLRYALGTPSGNDKFYFKAATFDNGKYDTGPSDGHYAKKLGTVDINADGRSDVLYLGKVWKSVPQVDGTWKLAATPVQFGWAYNQNKPWQLQPFNTMLADANGDGLTDHVRMGLSTHKDDNGKWSFDSGLSVSTLAKDPDADVTSSQYYGKGGFYAVDDHKVYCYTGESWITDDSCNYAGDEVKVPDSVREVGPDFNGDGRTDFMASGIYRVDCSDEDLDGNGAPECKIEIGGLYPYTIVPGDSGTLKFEQYVTRSSDPHRTVYGMNNSWAVTMTPDINGDGLSDLFGHIGGKLEYRLNTGAGFNEPKQIDLNDTPHGVELVDMNNDGYPDIVWLDNGSRQSTVSQTYTHTRKINHWDPETNSFEQTSHSLPSESVKYIRYEHITDERKGGISIGNLKVKAKAIRVGYASRKHMLMDLDKDGFPDMLSVPTDDSGDIYIRKNIQSPESVASKNKIINIAKGHGHRIDISYEPVARSKHYSRISGIGATTEEQCWVEVVDEDDGDFMDVCGDVAVADTTEFYRSMNDPWYDLDERDQSLRSVTPVLEAFGPLAIVTSVEKSSPVGNEAANATQYIDINNTSKTSYYYHQMKVQSGGRGMLGFKQIRSLNHQNGVSEVTKLRQDWPFNGKPRSKTTYSEAGNKLAETAYLHGFVECYDDAGNSLYDCADDMAELAESSGTAALGPLQLFTREIVVKSYALENNGDDQGKLLSTTTTINTPDGKGNEKEKVVIMSGLNKDGVNELSLHKTNTKSFDYGSAADSWSQQLGRLERLEIETYNDNFGNPVNRISSFTYLDNGLLETETIEPDQADYAVVSNHSYDTFGNRMKTWTTAEGQTRYSLDVEYDSRGRYVDKDYGYYTNGDNPSVGQRALSSAVFSRDKFGTPTETRSYLNKGNSSSYTTSIAAITPMGTTYFVADSSGASATTTGGAGNYSICSDSHIVRWVQQSTNTGAKTLSCYDLNGRSVRQGTISFDGTDWSVTDSEYNRLGGVLRTSNPYFFSQGVSSQNWTENRGVDILGRTGVIFHPLREDGVRPSTQFSFNNNEKTVTNAKGHARTETKNVLGHVVKVQEQGVSGTTQFVYDPRNNLREMRDSSGNVTAIDYDLRDRKISMNDPNKGRLSYKYNRFSELICEQDAKGQTITRSYDIQGRMFSRTDRKAGGNCNSPSGSVEKYSQWQYDTATNGMGQLAQVWDSNTIRGTARYQREMTYDGLGRMSTTETRFPGHLDSTSTHHEKVNYDNYGRVFQSFDAARVGANFDKNGIQNVYNSQGYLERVVDAESKNGYHYPYYLISEMDERGKVTKAFYGNGVQQSARYYRDSGLAKTLATYSPYLNDNIQHLTLEWDEVHNLENRTESGAGIWATQQLRSRNIVESFTYDGLNRLETWTSSQDISEFAEVGYNDIGNITNKTAYGDYSYGDQCSHTNAGPHAVCKVGSKRYYYDANGNIVSDSGGRSLKYSVFNKTVEVSQSGHVTSFDYDPERSRYRRVDNGADGKTTTLYVGDLEKIHYPNGEIHWKRSLAGVAMLTEKVTAQGAVLSEDIHYLHYDHLGSLNLTTTAEGYVHEEYYFDPWGDSRTPAANSSDGMSWEDTQPFLKANRPVSSRGYTGHEMLDEVELIHMNGRMYDAKIGRFVQADPIIQDPLKSQSLNRYAYVWNNPLNHVDPTGYEVEYDEEVVVTGHSSDVNSNFDSQFNDFARGMEFSASNLSNDLGMSQSELSSASGGDADGFGGAGAAGSMSSAAAKEAEAEAAANADGALSAAAMEPELLIEIVPGLYMTEAQAMKIVNMLERGMDIAEIVDNVLTMVGIGSAIFTGGASIVAILASKGIKYAIKKVIKAGIKRIKRVVKEAKESYSRLMTSRVTKSGPKLLPAPKAKAPKGNANNAPENGTIFVDSKGNGIVTPPGGKITGSPDGRFIQARDANGNPTGVRIDGAHSPKTHTDSRALGPHGHVPGTTNADGTPWLPINQ